jgi:hypothetical protein
MATAATPALVKLSPGERARLYAEHLIMLALGKACYKRADSLLEIALAQSDRYRPQKITRRNLGRKSIAAKLREAQNIIVATVIGKSFIVSDKFANRNSVAVGQNARRFELEQVE